MYGIIRAKWSAENQELEVTGFEIRAKWSAQNQELRVSGFGIRAAAGTFFKFTRALDWPST